MIQETQVPNVVLVTGVSRYLGAILAARLASNPKIERILGVDTVSPRPELARQMGRTEFVRADVRNPLIAKVITDAQVDTVVHTALSSHASKVGRAAIKEMNVIGAMQLLAACQESPHVRKLVVESTSAVYGSSSRDPAVFTEEMEPKDLPSSGLARDAAEIEKYIRGFGRRRPDVDITTLRFANLIGPRIDVMLTRYFALPVVPTVFGYDARLQLLHSEDALTVLERATVNTVPGVFNVGGDGVLMLSQAIRRAGRVALPVPSTAISPLSKLLPRARVDFSPERTRFLNFGRVLDTSRLRDKFRFIPRWTSREAFDDYVRGRQLRPLIDPNCIAAAERGVANALPKSR